MSADRRVRLLVAMMEKGKSLDGTVADGTDQSRWSDKKISGRVEE